MAVSDVPVQNPVFVQKNKSSNKDSTPGVHDIVGRVVGGGSHSVVIETKCKAVLSAIVINETDGAVVATVIADSTATTGTKKVTFSVADTKEYSYRITAIYNFAPTVPTTSGTTTVTVQPVSGS